MSREGRGRGTGGIPCAARRMCAERMRPCGSRSSSVSPCAHRCLTWWNELKNRGFTVGILSDQTNWLDELDDRFGFYGRFDYIFNSFHMGKSKNDATHFDDVLRLLNRQGQEVLFIDDNAGHVGRAVERGWKAILYGNLDGFLQELSGQLPPELPASSIKR